MLTQAGSNNSIARNTLWNFLGLGVPIVVAVFAIPFLIKGLGTERFGLLTLAWVVMGYFGLFDFGLGRATTKFVAEYHGNEEFQALHGLICTSATLHAGLGVLGGLILALLTPWLTIDVFKITQALLAEAEFSFYLLAVSIPVIVVTAVFRGVLEGIHRFDLVNLVKIPASMANFIGPLLVLLFTRNLAIVILAIVLFRGIALLAYFYLSLRLLPQLNNHYKFDKKVVRPLVSFGGWLTVSNLVNPVIVSLDRFLIGSLISISAVAYYATPYEVITKLWIFSASLLGALFPVFSALSVRQRLEIRALSNRAVIYLLVMVAPIVGLLLATSSDLLLIWVGEDFKHQSTAVAMWLAIGTLINVLAQVPLTALHSIGRADITAKISLVQAPFFAAAVWYMAQWYGIAGVAFTWAVRAAIEAGLLFVIADGLLPIEDISGKRSFRVNKIITVSLCLLGFWGVSLLLFSMVLIKISVTFALLVLFSLWEWRYLLNESDRKTLLGSSKAIMSGFLR